MKLPVEFNERMKLMLKDEYEDYLESLNRGIIKGIRVNTLKVGIEEFKGICPFELKEPIPWEQRGFYIDEEKPGRHPYHQAGLYYIQEPSAMAVVPCLGIQPGEKVLDLCAAPGGKSTQAAAYLNSSGLLVSNEIEPKRARVLSENIERMGIKNAVVTNNSPKELEAVFPAFFDRIIVDAPCSGEGMFKKEDAAAADWSIENVAGCSERQKEILESAASMLKAEGHLVYSTCTFSIEENEGVIDCFLKSHSEFELININKKYGFVDGLFKYFDNKELSKTARLFPHKLKGEGHFIALLRKNDGDEYNHSTFQGNISKNTLKDYYSFIDTNLNSVIETNLHTVGDNLYSLPYGINDLKGLKVLRGGLHLGTFKKNRFEPNHALALVLKKDNAKRYVNFKGDSNEIISYLKGDTINVNIEDGWCLVLVDGYSIGWGKVSGGIMKNHYPKGLRW